MRRSVSRKWTNPQRPRSIRATVRSSNARGGSRQDVGLGAEVSSSTDELRLRAALQRPDAHAESLRGTGQIPLLGTDGRIDHEIDDLVEPTVERHDERILARSDLASSGAHRGGRSCTRTDFLRARCRGARRRCAARERSRPVIRHEHRARRAHERRRLDVVDRGELRDERVQERRNVAPSIAASGGTSNTIPAIRSSRCR